MARKQFTPSSKKVPIGIFLDDWIWELAERAGTKRSEFFRQLLLEKIKQDLGAVGFKDLQQTDEFLGHLYRAFIVPALKKQPVREGRIPLRSNARVKGKAISLPLERWIWDLVSEIEPNRSRFFKKLVLEKIEQSLINDGLIESHEIIGRKHGELFEKLYMKKDKKCG